VKKWPHVIVSVGVLVGLLSSPIFAASAFVRPENYKGIGSLHVRSDSKSGISSIVNGESALNEGVVVAIFRKNATDPHCTGGYFKERVVITAAHCVVPTGLTASEWKYSAGEYFVSQPSVDWKSPIETARRVSVTNIAVTPTYRNVWNPQSGIYDNEVDDIAYLYLSKDLEGIHADRLATAAEIVKIQQGSIQLQHIGYGCTFYDGVKYVANAGIPFKVNGIIGTQRRQFWFKDPARYLQADYPVGKSICPGDSGSPLLAKIGAETVYVGVVFAGDGWKEVSSGQNAPWRYADVTVIGPYSDAFETSLTNFVNTEKIELALKAKQEADAKAAAELKAKQEADAKAALSKKLTITCVKGTSVKKVTGVNPSCPTGYRKK
jgi:secreted trypsin-like serine protease